MQVESVDAREMLKHNPDLYSDQAPEGEEKEEKDEADKTYEDRPPVNIDTVESEFRREPVGDDNPGPERDVTVIRNPVTEKPRMAMPASNAPEAADAEKAALSKDQLEGMTVPELREFASQNQIDLSGTTHKAEIIKEIRKAQRK